MLNATSATAPQAALLAAEKQAQAARSAANFESLLAQVPESSEAPRGRTGYRAAHGVPNLLLPLAQAGLPAALKDGTAAVVVRRPDGSQKR